MCCVNTHAVRVAKGTSGRCVVQEARFHVTNRSSHVLCALGAGKKPWNDIIPPVNTNKRYGFNHGFEVVQDFVHPSINYVPPVDLLLACSTSQQPADRERVKNTQNISTAQSRQMTMCWQ